MSEWELWYCDGAPECEGHSPNPEVTVIPCDSLRKRSADRARKDNLWLLHEAGYEFLHAITDEGYLVIRPDGEHTYEQGHIKVFPTLAAAVDAATEHMKGRE